MLKREKIKILIVVGISVALLSVYIFATYIVPQNIPPPSLPLAKGEEKGGGQIILEINGTKYESNTTGVTNVYELMEKLQKEGAINFKDKTYSGMGKFIEEINGIQNSGEKNWIYYVNNKKANIGISNYKIKTGDIVSWKYEKENY